MAGGVNPIEWVLPPVALSHMAYNAVAQQTAPKYKVDTPESPNARTHAADAAAEQQRNALLAKAEAEKTSAAADLAARTETPQEAVEARRRAQVSQVRLGGGKRRASQTLTDPGMTLSGSY